MSAAITSTDQLVFAGSLDGNLNVYDSLSGEILWSFDTFGDFESVSAIPHWGAPSSLTAPCCTRGMC
jgi:polyvinyl alcohol dehydrogenase (cytochrome)